MKKIIIFALLIFCLGSCYPAKLIKTPALDGKVVDIETQEPIQDALIHFMDFENNQVITDRYGYFKLPKNEGWGVVGMIDRVPPQGILIIEAEGYEKTEYEVGWAIDFDGIVEMKKKK